MWRPEIVKKPLSTPSRTPHYFVRLWGMIAGDQVEDARYDGPGEPEVLQTAEEACAAVEQQLRKHFQDGDSIEWSGQTYGDVDAAMAEVRKNPLAESEAR